MDRPMTENERRLIPEIVSLAAMLPREVRERWLWIGEGMVYASSQNKKDDDKC